MVKKEKRPSDETIKKAMKQIRVKYGITGFDGKYLLAQDKDGDWVIAACDHWDVLLYKNKMVKEDNFIKIKELVDDTDNGRTSSTFLKSGDGREVGNGIETEPR